MGKLTGNFKVGYKNGVYPGNKTKNEKKKANDKNGNDGIFFCKGAYINCSSQGFVHELQIILWVIETKFSETNDAEDLSR